MATEPELPFSGLTVQSRHASWTGTQEAQYRAGSQIKRLLALYQSRGPLSDQQAAGILGLPLATINARRSQLMKDGYVGWIDFIPGIGKAKQSRWGVRST